MGNIVQYNKKRSISENTEQTYSELPDDVKEALGKYRREAIQRAEEMSKNPKAYSREERRKLSRDMEYAQLAYENNWSDEEFKNNREAFDKIKDEERRISEEQTLRLIDVLYNGGKGLSEFERRQTKKYIEDNPEDVDILTGLVNMIEAGINDPEHITDYSD